MGIGMRSSEDHDPFVSEPPIGFALRCGCRKCEPASRLTHAKDPFLEVSWQFPLHRFRRLGAERESETNGKKKRKWLKEHEKPCLDTAVCPRYSAHAPTKN